MLWKILLSQWVGARHVGNLKTQQNLFFGYIFEQLKSHHAGTKEKGALQYILLHYVFTLLLTLVSSLHKAFL